MKKKLEGVIAAALTPLRGDYSIDYDMIPPYLDFLARRGCHGALLFGTTGEGTSLAPEERIRAFKEAMVNLNTNPSFVHFAGTGTPSLDESVLLTKAAFDYGFDGVVVLPPYYYRTVSDDGLFEWYSLLIQKAVPSDGAIFGYHFPSVSGVPLSMNLLIRLKQAYPHQFYGIKNSHSEASWVTALGENFGRGLTVFTGDDRLFSFSLQNGASGCITASATLVSQELRRVWDAYQQAEIALETQEHLNRVREIIIRYPPAPPLIKAMLAKFHGFPRWTVRPPLVPLPDEVLDKAQKEFEAELISISQQ